MKKTTLQKILIKHPGVLDALNYAIKQHLLKDNILPSIIKNICAAPTPEWSVFCSRFMALSNEDGSVSSAQRQLLSNYLNDIFGQDMCDEPECLPLAYRTVDTSIELESISDRDTDDKILLKLIQQHPDVIEHVTESAIREAISMLPIVFNDIMPAKIPDHIATTSTGCNAVYVGKNKDGHATFITPLHCVGERESIVLNIDGQTLTGTVGPKQTLYKQTVGPFEESDGLAVIYVDQPLEIAQPDIAQRDTMPGEIGIALSKVLNLSGPITIVQHHGLVSEWDSPTNQMVGFSGSPIYDKDHKLIGVTLGESISFIPNHYYFKKQGIGVTGTPFIEFIRLALGGQ